MLCMKIKEIKKYTMAGDKVELDYKGNKSFRLLQIYERLNKGEKLIKENLSNDYGVNIKTIQRDIQDLRVYLQENHYLNQETTIKYDKTNKVYKLIKYQREWLTNEEIMAACKILLESRAFCKEELDNLINKLLDQSLPEHRTHIERIIKNEQFNYIPLQHGKQLLSTIWNLSEAINNNERILIHYSRQDKKQTVRDIKPVSIMFSEFYFYLIAYISDFEKDIPTVYRIDRIQKYENLHEKFKVPYSKKFQDGEFRKRVQFMYSGELKKVKFEFTGKSLEAILDRLPTAEVISQDGDKYTIKAESYGDGIDMWLRSQGDKVKIL